MLELTAMSRKEVPAGRYPQIYESDQRLVVDPASVRVERQDFFTAAASITPSSHRGKAPVRNLWSC
eukprot:1138839-Pelagomonas_calceolata.AAC.7